MPVLWQPTVYHYKPKENFFLSIWNKNQLMSLFQYYSYIARSLHVSGPQSHLQENSHSCLNSCVNSPEDGPVGPKHVEIRQYMNNIEIVTSVGFYSICWKDARYKKLKILLEYWQQLRYETTNPLWICIITSNTQSAKCLYDT